MHFVHISHSISRLSLSIQVPPPSLSLPPAAAISIMQWPSIAVKSQLQSHANCDVDPNLVPRHLAVTTDGNVRWARQRGIIDSAGHEAGSRSLKELVGLCLEWRIPVLTVFAFSCDNWNRPRAEVDFLLSLFEGVLNAELQYIEREGIRVSTIGDTVSLPNSLKQLVQRVEETTKNNTNLHLVIALNYSGRRDILKACRAISQKVKSGEIQPEDINETTIEEHMENNFCQWQSPDLMIRTSGEQRLSNFMLWQLAYTEFVFVPTLWPDFGEDEFLGALATFQRRKRRYGRRID